jgi:hypothetical protein
MQFAIALFTWSGLKAPPPWLKVLGAIGFWGWWAFVAAGAACVSASRPKPSAWASLHEMHQRP